MKLSNIINKVGGVLGAKTGEGKTLLSFAAGQGAKADSYAKIDAVLSEFFCDVVETRLSGHFSNLAPARQKFVDIDADHIKAYLQENHADSLPDGLHDPVGVLLIKQWDVAEENLGLCRMYLHNAIAEDVDGIINRAVLANQLAESTGFAEEKIEELLCRIEILAEQKRDGAGYSRPDYGLDAS